MPSQGTAGWEGVLAVASATSATAVTLAWNAGYLFSTPRRPWYDTAMTTHESILAVNAMESAAGQRDFAAGIEAAAAAVERPVHVVAVDELEAVRRELTAGRFSHLVISGSEASITEEQEWEAELRTVLDTALDGGLPVLGLCYGAQLIAKHLGGPEAVGKLETPEFGYLRIPLPDASAAGAETTGTAEPTAGRPPWTKLFAGISNPVGIEMHYDCIRAAPPGFSVLSRSDRAIQIMVHEEAPVVAYQFHPEFSYDFAEQVFAERAAEEPRWQEIYLNELADPRELEQNVRFLTNALTE